MESYNMKNTRELNVDYIIDKVSMFFDIDKSDIFSKWRLREVVEARHYIIYYLFYYGKGCNYSPNRVRTVMKDRGGLVNHASVIHAVRKINNNLDVSRESNEVMACLDVWVGVKNKSFVDIHFFMNINKGEITSFRFNDTPSGKILWRHEGIERRGSRVYIKGKIFKDNNWIDSDSDVYQYNGTMCYGLDADKIYADEPKIS